MAKLIQVKSLDPDGDDCMGCVYDHAHWADSPREERLYNCCQAAKKLNEPAECGPQCPHNTVWIRDTPKGRAVYMAKRLSK